MKNRIVYLTVFILFLSMTSTMGQAEQAQRKVSYSTSTVKRFKVPCDVVIEDLSPLDMVYLETKPALFRQTDFVFKNSWLSISNTYPQKPRYDRDYEFQMGKSIVDAYGTRLYTHDGEEYHSMQNEEVDSSFMLTEDEMSNYGFFNNLFGASITEMQEYLEEMEVQHYIWGQKVVTIYEEENEFGEITRTETEMDLEHFYFETRIFEDNVHTLTNRLEYQAINGNIIPLRNKHIYYSELPSETRYQITKIVQYLSYQVVDNNANVLADWANPFEIHITPNPASDSIWVYFSNPINGEINLQIVDADNNIVLELENMVDGQKLLLDITTLTSGLYTVLCTYQDETALAIFSKEGIGQYDNPNITTMSIQIVPNPATNTIEVVFPMAINAVMLVKIMNTIGYTYINEEIYVSGNTLPIDIQSFPQGIYVITCTNNDSIAHTRFLKQ